MSNFEAKSGATDQQIQRLQDSIQQFDVSTIGAEWSPSTGTDLVPLLTELAEALEKKSCEIRKYTRAITREELNELDGFDRCSVAQETDMDAQRPS